MKKATIFNIRANLLVILTISMFIAPFSLSCSTNNEEITSSKMSANTLDYSTESRAVGPVVVSRNNLYGVQAPGSENTSEII